MPWRLFRKFFGFLKRPIVFGSLLVALLFIVLFTPLSFFKNRSSYMCSGCLSRRDIFQWTFGPPFSGVPITPEWQVITVSHTSKNFGTTNHQHQWEFAQGSPYRFGYIWSGCAIGAGRHISELAEFYEQSEDFREYFAVQAQERNLTREQILALLTLPMYPEAAQKNSEAFRTMTAASSNMLDNYFKQ